VLVCAVAGDPDLPPADTAAELVVPAAPTPSLAVLRFAASVQLLPSHSSV